MDINEMKIVADSSADVLELSGVGFGLAPLKIITSEKEYVDNGLLDVQSMVSDLASYKGKSSSSCPNALDWLDAFGDAKYVFCVTITSGLSGSYASAVMAKTEYEQKHPDRKVFVLDSLSAGPELTLFVYKFRQLILQGFEFERVCEEIQNYSHGTGLLFVLESLKNFANNGRVKPIVAKAVGLLGIRMVGKASDSGDLQPLDKCRGEQKALKEVLSHLKEEGLLFGKVIIHHCQNPNAATELKDMILSELPNATVEVSETLGLCSFYAEKGGLLIGFEKM